MTVMYADKTTATILIDESCNATESSSIASSFEESESKLLRKDRWAVTSLKTKHPSKLRNDGSKSLTRSESTSTSSTPTNPQSSGDTIRSRLLNKLGIEPDAPQRQTASTASPQPSFHENIAFFVSLKADYGAPDNSRVSPQDRTAEEKKRIVFNPEVKVQPIPSHTDFSERIRRVMWTNAEEMDENTARNCLEYTAEGWDWRNVVDDDEMIVVNGEKIHPIHFEHEEYNLNRQFAAVMSAQQQ